MIFSSLVGKTLRSLALSTTLHQKTFRVFVLRNAQDDTEQQVAQDYSIRYILWHHPELATAKVVRAEDYYGQIILRVLLPDGR